MWFELKDLTTGICGLSFGKQMKADYSDVASCSFDMSRLS